MEKFTCGRRGGWFAIGAEVEKEDHWREDNTCSYCGSLNPDTLLSRLRQGDVELGPTDKSYKLYVNNSGGEPFKQTYRSCPRDCKVGPEECTHWVTRDTNNTKFYFQHFNEQHRHEFITLYNEKKLKFGYPGYFYTMPYFCAPADKGI